MRYQLSHAGIELSAEYGHEQLLVAVESAQEAAPGQRNVDETAVDLADRHAHAAYKLIAPYSELWESDLRECDIPHPAIGVDGVP